MVFLQMAPIILWVEMGGPQRLLQASPCSVTPWFQAASISVGVAGRRQTSCYFRCYFRLLKRKNRDFSRFLAVVPVEGLEPPPDSNWPEIALLLAF